MTQVMAYRTAVAMQRAGERGESVPEDLRYCPCGAPAASPWRYVTEWFDPSGITTDWVVIRLCADHKARQPGEEH